MAKLAAIAMFAVALAFAVAMIDFEFLRNRVWLRLIFHIALAAVFVGFFFRIAKRI